MNRNPQAKDVFSGMLDKYGKALGMAIYFESKVHDWNAQFKTALNYRVAAEKWREHSRMLYKGLTMYIDRYADMADRHEGSSLRMSLRDFAADLRLELIRVAEATDQEKMKWATGRSTPEPGDTVHWGRMDLCIRDPIGKDFGSQHREGKVVKVTPNYVRVAVEIYIPKKFVKMGRVPNE